MLPIILDVAHLHIALVGQGPQALRRLRLIDAAQAQSVRVYSVTPDDEMRDLAGDRLVENLPCEDEIARLDILYVAGVSSLEQEQLAGWARAHKTLINVEDVRPLCDFHVPASVRRGDLLLTVSTNGKSPGLARRLKQDLAEKYPAIWEERLNSVAAARADWLAQKLPFDELNARSQNYIREKAWFDE